MYVRSVVVNSTSILVSWKAVETFAEPVVVYTLYYNADEEKQVYAINITATYNTSNYNHVLTGLEPFTTYMMYMTATNEGYGEGGPSESTAEKTLPAGKETTAIIELSNIRTGSKVDISLRLAN